MTVLSVSLISTLLALAHGQLPTGAAVSSHGQSGMPPAGGSPNMMGTPEPMMGAPSSGPLASSMNMGGPQTAGGMFGMNVGPQGVSASDPLAIPMTVGGQQPASGMFRNNIGGQGASTKGQPSSPLSMNMGGHQAVNGMFGNNMGGQGASTNGQLATPMNMGGQGASANGQLATPMNMGGNQPTSGMSAGMAAMMKMLNPTPSSSHSNMAGQASGPFELAMGGASSLPTGGAGGPLAMSSMRGLMSNKHATGAASSRFSTPGAKGINPKSSMLRLLPLLRGMNADTKKMFLMFSLMGGMGGGSHGKGNPMMKFLPILLMNGGGENMNPAMMMMMMTQPNMSPQMMQMMMMMMSSGGEMNMASLMPILLASSQSQGQSQGQGHSHGGHAKGGAWGGSHSGSSPLPSLNRVMMPHGPM